MLITPEVLSKFSSFRHMSEYQQQNLLGLGELKLFHSMPGDKIITRGSNDDYSFFLVSGTLKLVAKDGYTAIIKADSESAMQPITQLKPRQYDVLAENTVSYLKVRNQFLENLNASTQGSKSGIQLENESNNADVYFQLYHDIKGDHIVLPSLADVAGKINKYLSAAEKKFDVQQVGNIILADPAIAAKIIKLSLVNKASEGTSEVEEISKVINRLGLNKTIEVARLLSEKDIFKPANEMQHVFIKELWHETIFVSVIASVLAEEFEHLDPKKAQLVGLVHNIGAILILDCLGKDKSFISDNRQMRAIIDELGNNISGMLLQKWGFAQPYIDAAKDFQYWKRNNDGQPLDYCDLVIIAKLLSCVSTSKIEESPVLTELAVFKKLNWGKNGVVQGLQVLKRAKQKMHNLIQVFEA